MKSRWLMRSIAGSLWRTNGYYTRSEVAEFLCSKPVRRIKRWERLTDALRKTWSWLVRR